MLYVTVIGIVWGFSKVTFGGSVVFWHTPVVPVMDAVGVGLTVTVVDPEISNGQFGAVWY